MMSLLLGDSNGPGPFLAEPTQYEPTSDHRVRYLACEALFNIAKVAHEELMPYLARIFDGLSRLAGDVVPDVRHAAQVLDRLLKDITSQHQDRLCVATFVDELAKRLKYKNPMIRQLCLGWTSLVLTMENVDLESFIPRFLEGIFEVMETHDHSRDSRQNADHLLDKCLEKVKQLKPPEKLRRVIFLTAQQLAGSCKNGDKVVRVCSLCWLYEYLILTPNWKKNKRGEIEVEANEAEEKEWRNGWSKNLPFVIDGVYECLKDTEHEDCLESWGLPKDCLPVDELVSTVCAQLTPPIAPDGRPKREQEQRNVTIQLHGMLEKKTMKELFTPVFNSLTSTDDEVVIAALRILAKIMEAHPPEALSIADLAPEPELDSGLSPKETLGEVREKGG
ncbi:Protein VAC14 homolog [Durusdinium trenchii]|uniref:Protein VAC14 homolog n=1 Tax=Durusdinium trenchii TaxID=1381693 RepID=A0ABP0SR96_9DINO